MNKIQNQVHPLNKVIKIYLVVMITTLIFFLSKAGYTYNDNLGYMLFSLLPLILVLLLDFPKKKLVYFLCFMMLGIQWMFHLTSYPINGPDSTNYYNYLSYTDNLANFLNIFWADFNQNFLKLSIYNSFGIIYLPFYFFFDTRDPYLIAGVNMLFTTLTIFLFTRIIQKDHKTKLNNVGLTVFLIIAFLSPSLIYWSSTFLKDITILLICIFSTYLLLKKRYFLFLLILLFSYTVRPYAAVAVVCYYIVFKQKRRLAILGGIFSFLIVIYKAGVLGGINSFITLGFTLLSPNPFSIDNWINESYRTLESGITIIMILFILLVFFKIKESRSFLITCFSSIYIYNCVLTLISFVHLNYLNESYGLGAGADDLSRKKLMVSLLIYYMFAYTVGIVNKKREGRQLLKH